MLCARRSRVDLLAALAGTWYFCALACAEQEWEQYIPFPVWSDRRTSVSRRCLGAAHVSQTISMYAALMGSPHTVGGSS